MQKLVYFSLSFFLGLFMACGGAQKSVAPVSVSTSNMEKAAANQMKLTAVISGAEGNLGLYKFDGIGFKTLQEFPAVKGDTFVLALPKGEPEVYYLGKDNLQKLPVVVGPEDRILVTGNIQNIRQSVFTGSEWNVRYNEVIQQIANNKRELQSIGQQMRQAQNNPQKISHLQTMITAIDQRKLEQVTTLSENYPFLSKLAAIDNYQSYATDKKGYAQELDHYVNEFFSGADWNDPVYNQITFVFEAFRDYATTLASIGMPEEQVSKALNIQMAKIPENSLTYKYALGGITLALQSKNHPAFIEFGGKFYDKYKEEEAPYIQQLGRQIGNARSLAVGAVAPDFTQKTPEGKPMNLSDLRGKVVLLDFWASWCGPCRRENPNVVKLYQKYKDKGFDVLGVSLDQTKDKWLNAIQKDGLEWHHVSDLKGWQNEVAAAYSVRSIPHTILLDDKGQIIARNLRGPELDKQLEKIFGF